MRHIKYIYKKRWMVFLIRFIDLIGYSFVSLLTIFKKPSPVLNSARNILIFKLDHIGDVLMITPALRFLRLKYPETFITVVVGSWSKDILIGNQDVNEILIYDAYWFNRTRYKKLNIINTWKFIKKIRGRKFDVFYSLRGDFMGILLSILFKIPVRIGFANGGGGFFLTHPITPVENIHQIEQFLYAVGGNDSVFDKKMRLPISDKERGFADTLIRQYSIKSPLSPFGKGGGAPKQNLGRGIFVGFHIGAGYPSKLWAPEKYGVLIKRLHDDFDTRAILIGGEEDREIIAETESIIRDAGAIDFIGRTNIKETAAIIERCSLFIGNDSAPVHIAAAVGTPVIVIFSAVNNPVQWKPFGDNVICITKDISCHFCEKFECEDTKCMHMITVEEVYDKVKEILVTKDMKKKIK